MIDGTQPITLDLVRQQLGPLGNRLFEVRHVVRLRFTETPNHGAMSVIGQGPTPNEAVADAVRHALNPETKESA